MNILKLGRGNFFGIIIPGSFLLFNTIIIFAEVIDSKMKLIENQLWTGKGVGIAFFFIVSYVVGIGLRLLPPKYIEWVAIIFTIPYKFFSTLFSINKISEFWIKFTELFSQDKEEFPYINIFFNRNLKLTSNKMRLFFEDILEEEFDGKIENMNNSIFINECKSFIRRSNGALGDEILYNEGLVRFVSGIVYSFVFVITLFFLSGINNFMTVIYAVVALLFLFSLKRIRRKEVFIILAAYAHVSMAEREGK